MRVLIEVLHIAIGLVAAYVIASLSAWSYPLAKKDIWLVTYVAMIAVVAMGVGPLRRAYAADKAKLGGAPGAPADG
ncbi:hypothetical protein [Sphingomonas soli]|uniref:hypothetical protein n=1 Tax=Sphingomonas soli TaxID=266127 RepID=UPI000830D957|nr:hypothetical protein [Sphingomonas soli]